jgi:hypothetical protein
MTGVGVAFTDPVTGERCELVILNGKPYVTHAGCDGWADVVVVLDAFYCGRCRWSGRVSGAWVMDVMAGSRP